MGNEISKKSLMATSADEEPEFDPLSAALRSMHDSIMNEAIPKDFLVLLDKIDAKMSAQTKFE